MSNSTALQKHFESMGEFFAAGYFEKPEKSQFIRFSRALRRFYENYKLHPFNGEPLYPCGGKGQGTMINPDFSFTIAVSWWLLEEKDEIGFNALKEELSKYNSLVPREHTVGGNMYTHSYPNFRRIVREGLDSYEQRITKIKDDDIRIGLLDLIAGIRNYHTRILQKLKVEAENTELYKALQKVPFKPAETLYEALVCWNFVYYLDYCDNIGRLDADLIDFYRGEDVTEIIRCFFKNVDINNGWSGALGPDYNALTVQCIKACKGIRKPSIELRVTPDMPEAVWAAAIDSIKAGGGSPCLYNEEGYQKALENLFPEIPKEDLLCFAGGGCTETMLAGLSNVGSLDAGINLALIFEPIMRKVLPEAKSFEEFYNSYIKECHIQIDRVLDAINASQKLHSENRPHPMRTLLIDDCIEKGKDYNNGGARYSWSIVNLAGLINVIDSMLVINQLVFKDRKFSGAELLECMDNGENFLDFDIPRHGTDSTEANAMAKRISTDICSAFDGKTPYSGGKFLASSIQFTTYVGAGKYIGATPDGRKAGAPLCDSIGAIHGNDKNGPTALLNSATSLCQEKMAGTPVLNIRLDGNQASIGLKALVNGYFKSGGMQMQVTCVNKEELLDAKENPEKYPNLIVRIGGYSEYFSRLNDELKQTVIDRTVYGI